MDHEGDRDDSQACSTNNYVANVCCVVLETSGAAILHPDGSAIKLKSKAVTA